MKTKKELRKFEFESIGMPPLKMVLGNIPAPDPGKGAARKGELASERPLKKSDAVLRLIDHLITFK